MGLFIIWSAIVVAAFLFVDVMLSTSTLIVGFFLITTGLMYALVPAREIAYLKLPFISLVWAIATVILPVYLTGLEDDIDLWTVFAIVLSRGLYIAGLTIPFDVRDLDIDQLEHENCATNDRRCFIVILGDDSRRDLRQFCGLDSRHHNQLMVMWALH